METYFWTVYFWDLVIPAVMIAAGLFMWKHPPKEINPIVGFRTDASMSSPEAWKFANTYAGKIWWKVGWIMLGITAVAQLFFIDATQPRTLMLLSLIVCLAQTAVLVISIVPIQRRLKQKFGDRQ